MRQVYNRVMIVDDDVTDIFIAARILRITKFADHILEFSNVRAALGYLTDHHDAPPDLIFLDINMPEFNGFDFLDAFNHYPEHVKQKSKIIILSSSDNKNDIDRILSNPYVIKFVTKPFISPVSTVKP